MAENTRARILNALDRMMEDAAKRDSYDRWRGIQDARAVVERELGEHSPQQSVTIPSRNRSATTGKYSRG